MFDRFRAFVGLVGCLVVVLGVACGGARAEKCTLGVGWEAGGAYNSLFDPMRSEAVKGSLVEFRRVVPLPGMAPALAMVVRSIYGETLEVHLGPHDTLAYLTQAIQPGMLLKVTGSFATVEGREVFLAGRLRVAEVLELKLRSSRTGTPMWTHGRHGHMYAERLEQ